MQCMIKMIHRHVRTPECVCAQVVMSYISNISIFIWLIFLYNSCLLFFMSRIITLDAKKNFYRLKYCLNYTSSIIFKLKIFSFTQRPTFYYKSFNTIFGFWTTTLPQALDYSDDSTRRFL